MLFRSLFERKGVIAIEKTVEEEELMMTVLDNGAEDLITNEDSYVVYTTPENFIKVKEAMEGLGIKDFLTSEITYVASNEVVVTDEETKEKIYNLIDALEEIDDVQDVYHNFSD